jgi:RNA polymerase sigma-70 factor (ECF subfamily)
MNHPTRLEYMDLTDEALIEKFRAHDDLTVFKVLVKRYQHRVYSTAYRLLGNNDEAEEVVQDTFIKVHQNLDKYRMNAAFSSWIFRIAHNVCMDSLRAKQRRRATSIVSFDPQSSVAESDGAFGASQPVAQLADDKPDPSQVLDLSEQTEVVEASLRQLPEAQKTVLILHDIEGFSYQEIAEIVGTSIGTVRSRLHYGRIKLKELLNPYFSTDAKTLPVTLR